MKAPNLEALFLRSRTGPSQLCKSALARMSRRVSRRVAFSGSPADWSPGGVIGFAVCVIDRDLGAPGAGDVTGRRVPVCRLRWIGAGVHHGCQHGCTDGNQWLAVQHGFVLLQFSGTTGSRVAATCSPRTAAEMC